MDIILIKILKNYVIINGKIIFISLLLHSTIYWILKRIMDSNKSIKKYYQYKIILKNT